MASDLAGAATIGRASERDRIAARVADLAGGRGGVVLLSGEPGIGKTRLAVDSTAAAEAHDCLVAWGRCPEVGAAPAFWPWVQVVREVVDREGEAAVRDRLGAAAADVLSLIRATPAVAPGPTSADLAASSRFRLLDAVLRLLGGSGPLLLVLEDVHRADELSVALLRQLGTAAARLPVLLVATYRSAEVALGGPVAAALAELAGLPWCDDLALDPLADDAAVRLVAALPGCRLDEAAVRAVVARAGGNPLFLTQLARAPGGGTVLPVSLRELVHTRVAALPPSCQSLLEALAVGGREADVGRAAAVCGLSVGEAWSLLATAGPGLVVAEPGTRTASFTHALLQEAIYAELDAARRAELHERYAAVLAGPAADDPTLHAARADHALRAARGGRDVDAVGPLRAAAQAAAGRLAFAEAARLLGEALTEVGDGPAEQAAVLLELGEAELHAGRSAAARAHLERAADLAVRLDDPGLLAAAALGIGDCVVTVGQVDEALAGRLRQALDALGDGAPAVRVRLLARLAVELYWQHGGESRQVSADALRAAEALPDDPGILGEALWARLFTLRGPDRLADRLEIGRRLVDVAVRQRDDDVECRGRVWWVPELLRAGDLPAYRANVARLGLLARRSGQPLHQWYAELFAGQRALAEGEVADAAARIEAAAAVAARLGTGAGEIYRLAQLLVLRRDVGGLADLLDPVQAVADRYPALVTLRIMVAVLQAELGFSAEAADGLGRIAANGFAAVPPDSLWTTTLCYAAEVAQHVHDTRTAKAVADRLEPYRGTCAVHGIPVAWGAVDRAVGLARLAAGDPAAGADALRRALDLHQRWGFRALISRTRIDLADALAGGGEAEALADQAASEAAELGLTRLATRARQLGETLQASGPPPLAGPGGTLSPREMEVLYLLAAGVSNAGIAARLVLSINTVERHVRNVYAKLGVTNRAEAAALAARAQVAAPENSRSDHGFR